MIEWIELEWEESEKPQGQAGDNGSVIFALDLKRQAVWFTHRFEVNSLPRRVGRKPQGKRRNQLNK